MEYELPFNYSGFTYKTLEFIHYIQLVDSVSRFKQFNSTLNIYIHITM